MRKFTSSLIVLVLFCSIFFAFSLVSADSYNATSTDNTGDMVSAYYSGTNDSGQLTYPRNYLYAYATGTAGNYNYFDDNSNYWPYEFYGDKVITIGLQSYLSVWQIRRGFIEFDASGLPASFSVESASMKLYIDNINDAQDEYYRVVATNWDGNLTASNNLGYIGEDIGYFGGKSFKTFYPIGVVADSNSTERFDGDYTVRPLFVVDENIDASIQDDSKIYVFRADYKIKGSEGYSDYALAYDDGVYVNTNVAAFTFSDDVYTDYSIHYYAAYGDSLHEEFCGYVKDRVVYYEGYYESTSPSFVACSDAIQVTSTGWLEIPLNETGRSYIEDGLVRYSIISEKDYQNSFGSVTAATMGNENIVVTGTSEQAPYLVINYTEGEPENSVPTKPVIVDIGGVDANNSTVDDLTPSGNGTGSTDEDLDTLYYAWYTIETGGDFGTPDFNTTFSETVDVLSLGNLVNATEYDTILVVTDLTDTNQSDVFNFTVQVLAENSVPTKPVIVDIEGEEFSFCTINTLTPSGNGTGSTDEDLDTLYYCWLTVETGGDFGTPDFNTTFSEIVDVASLGNLTNATTYDTILVVTDLTDYNYSDILTYTIEVLEEEEEEPNSIGVILGGGGAYQGVLNTDQPSSFYRISFDGEMKTGQKVRAALVEQNINFCYNKVGYGTINYYKTGDSNLQGLPMVWMKCDNEQSKGYWYRDLIFTKPGAYIFEGDNLFYEAEINITGKEIIKPKESPLLKATGLREKLQALDLNEGIQTVKEIPVAIYNGLSWVADLLMNNAEKLIN